ncbi:MAG: UDP-N-acetylglucosamine--N-acetylmuramyl-(pentapeptide) pyrophosphoryl-undecaprenol N-acetylglucosamine transferase, partial [Bacteroidales bacterium]|nr:UDP-N-acetylglucosamine--N-acetylmuramyl-(pentapeptide) pyrophosphoryl-undecaprenol N-acetylglucosamine transferase [Bacteroidales bacterium]
MKVVNDKNSDKLSVHAFINRMDLAFAAADVIVSRAGAGTISELCLVGKPVILVPSPNVAEDHQTKNAMALVEKDAAIMIPDKDAAEQLVDKAIELVKDNNRKEILSKNIKQLEERDADLKIAKEVLKLVDEK